MVYTNCAKSGYCRNMRMFVRQCTMTVITVKGEFLTMEELKALPRFVRKDLSVRCKTPLRNNSTTLNALMKLTASSMVAPNSVFSVSFKCPDKNAS